MMSGQCVCFITLRATDPYELSVGVAGDNLGRDRDVKMVLLPLRQHCANI
jgi:hypothetical protein